MDVAYEMMTSPRSLPFMPTLPLGSCHLVDNAKLEHGSCHPVDNANSRLASRQTNPPTNQLYMSNTPRKKNWVSIVQTP